VRQPQLWWCQHENQKVAQAPPHFRDRNIVNPFNTFWFASAATRALQLMAKSPPHRDKYLWFLALHEAVSNGQELIPHDIFMCFVRDGILEKRTKDEECK
jgi:hypothetical protein